jgi:hypothetical protein
VVASAPVKTGRKKRMKEPYIEGVATHDDPESCAGVRARDLTAGGTWAQAMPDPLGGVSKTICNLRKKE